MVEFIIQNIRINFLQHALIVAAVEIILVVFVNQRHQLIIRHLHTRRGTSRNINRFFKAQYHWASWRYCQLHCHIHILTWIGQANGNIFAFLQFLKYIFKVNLVPVSLVSLQLQAILLPCFPIKINSIATSTHISCLVIQGKGNLLVGCQLDIEISKSRVNQSTYLRNDKLRYIERELNISWSFCLSNGVHRIFTTYRHTCTQCSVIAGQVLEGNLCCATHLVNQTHWELIPLGTCVLHIFLTRHNHLCIQAVCRRKDSSINALCLQLQFAICNYTYIYIM